jgi:hypothetical protein
MRVIAIILFISISSSCIKKMQSNNFAPIDIPQINFCDLPKYKEQKVVIECSFSGVDEYWSLHPLEKCGCNLKVEFDFGKYGEKVEKKFQLLFDSVYSSYWNKYLKLKMTGTFENKNPNGDGHLDSNDSRFILDSLLEVVIVSVPRFTGYAQYRFARNTGTE